jgi:ubiquinone/menaquinone biosynthesis C-methylase UbiE
MPSWFRKGLSPHHTALAMIGAKPGDRIVVIGATAPDLAAEIALVTGLNGSTIVLDENDERAIVDAAARKAGALVDFQQASSTTLPFETGSIDVVVLGVNLGTKDAGQRTAAVDEAMRVLRPGGRIIVIEGARSAGMLSSLREKPRRLGADEALELLDRAGYRARRQLADVEGVAFYEARKSAE